MRRGEQTRLTVDVPSELHRQAKVRAAMEGIDLREVVIMGLTMYLAGAKGRLYRMAVDRFRANRR